jgi:hypothetical protein
MFFRNRSFTNKLHLSGPVEREVCDERRRAMRERARYLYPRDWERHGKSAIMLMKVSKDVHGNHCNSKDI